MKLVNNSLKELTSSISSFNKVIGNKEGVYIGGDVETKEYKEDDIDDIRGFNNGPTIVRSGINKNMLFNNNKSNSKFSDNEKIVKNNFSFYEADTDDALVNNEIVNDTTKDKTKDKDKDKNIEKDKKESINNINTDQHVVKKSKFYDEVYDKTPKRTRLPNKRIDLNLNVWSILKDAIGKDLNKFCVPGK